jgi:4-hydroxy-tetrahydrodipicolinate synthase
LADFKGVIPYLVTPIGSGNIKDDVLATLCDDLIGCGVHGFTALGSTGVFAYLNRQQRQRVVDVTIGAASAECRLSSASPARRR